MRYVVTTDEFQTPCVVDRTTGRGVFYNPNPLTADRELTRFLAWEMP